MMMMMMMMMIDDDGDDHDGITTRPAPLPSSSPGA